MDILAFTKNILKNKGVEKYAIKMNVVFRNGFRTEHYFKAYF